MGAANTLLAFRDGISNTDEGQVQAENAASSDDQSMPRYAQPPRSSPHGDIHSTNTYCPKDSIQYQEILGISFASDKRIGKVEPESLQIRDMREGIDELCRLEIMQSYYIEKGLVRPVSKDTLSVPRSSKNIPAGMHETVINAIKRLDFTKPYNYAQSFFRSVTPESALSAAAMGGSANSIDATRGVARAKF